MNTEFYMYYGGLYVLGCLGFYVWGVLRGFRSGAVRATISAREDLWAFIRAQSLEDQLLIRKLLREFSEKSVVSKGSTAESGGAKN